MSAPLRCADMPPEHLHRTRAIHMMFFYASAGFHRDQNCSEIRLLIQRFGVDARWPGLLTLRVCDLRRQIKVCTNRQPCCRHRLTLEVALVSSFSDHNAPGFLYAISLKSLRWNDAVPMVFSDLRFRCPLDRNVPVFSRTLLFGV